MPIAPRPGLNSRNVDGCVDQAMCPPCGAHSTAHTGTQTRTARRALGAKQTNSCLHVVFFRPKCDQPAPKVLCRLISCAMRHPGRMVFQRRNIGFEVTLHRVYLREPSRRMVVLRRRGTIDREAYSHARRDKAKKRIFRCPFEPGTGDSISIGANSSPSTKFTPNSADNGDVSQFGAGFGQALGDHM